MHIINDKQKVRSYTRGAPVNQDRTKQVPTWGPRMLLRSVYHPGVDCEKLTYSLGLYTIHDTTFVL